MIWVESGVIGGILMVFVDADMATFAKAFRANLYCQLGGYGAHGLVVFMVMEIFMAPSHWLESCPKGNMIGHRFQGFLTSFIPYVPKLVLEGILKKIAIIWHF